MHKVHNVTVFIKGIYTSGNSRMAELVRPNIQKKIVDVRAWDDFMHKVHNGTVFSKGIYFRELTHGRTGSPEHPKENSRCAMCVAEHERYMIHYACRVRKGTVFIKGIYTSGNSRMAELVRPNIPKKIVDVRAWDDIMHKVHNGIVFIKGIYSSGNSRKAELVRPNIQKKIAVTCIHEMILCM